MDKSEFRKIISERTGGLSCEYRQLAGFTIAGRLVNTEEFKKAANIFIYISTDAEPSTAAIIEEALKCGKQVYVPKCRKKPFMDAVRINSTEELVPGKYGILEPKEALETIAPENIELAVIPCVAAAKDGRRIGHGAGYYDYFLKDCRKAFKCALCFGKLLSDEIPADEHDIRMDRVISEL